MAPKRRGQHFRIVEKPTLITLITQISQNNAEIGIQVSRAAAVVAQDGWKQHPPRRRQDAKGQLYGRVD